MASRKKWKGKYYKVKDELYSANNIISEYIDTWRKLKEKLQEDIEFFDKTKKLHETYSPSEERLNAKQHYAEEILEIIGGKNE